MFYPLPLRLSDQSSPSPSNISGTITKGRRTKERHNERAPDKSAPRRAKQTTPTYECQRVGLYHQTPVFYGSSLSHR